MKDTSQKLEDCFLLTHTDAQSKPMINFRTYGVYCLHNLFSFSLIFNYFPLFFFFYQHPVLLSLIEFALEAGGDELPQLRQKTLHHQVGQDLPRKKTATADRKSPERSWSG